MRKFLLILRLFAWFARAWIAEPGPFLLRIRRFGGCGCYTMSWGVPWGMGLARRGVMLPIEIFLC